MAVARKSKFASEQFGDLISTSGVMQEVMMSNQYSLHETQTFPLSFHASFMLLSTYFA
jgi:hypothetical protein